MNRDFSIFSRMPAASFLTLTLSLLWSVLSSTLLFSLTLPTSAFPSVHTVGSLTSKLPSNMYIYIYIYTRYIYIYIDIPYIPREYMKPFHSSPEAYWLTPPLTLFFLEKTKKRLRKPKNLREAAVAWVPAWLWGPKNKIGQIFFHPNDLI